MNQAQTTIRGSQPKSFRDTLKDLWESEAKRMKRLHYKNVKYDSPKQSDPCFTWSRKHIIQAKVDMNIDITNKFYCIVCGCDYKIKDIESVKKQVDLDFFQGKRWIEESMLEEITN